MARVTSIIDGRGTGRCDRVRKHVRCLSRRLSRRAGLTLAESLIAAVVLAVAVVGIMGPIAASHQQTRAAESSANCASLAIQLMDEIAARPYVDPTDQTTLLGPELDELSRAQFDNVDDFHGFRDSSDGSDGDLIRAVDGTVLTLQDPGVYKRSVLVEYRQSADGSPALVGDYALVRVVVEGEGGKRVEMNRMVTRFPRK